MSNTVSSSVDTMLPKLDNSVTMCLDSKDYWLSSLVIFVFVSHQILVLLAVFFLSVPAVELAEQRTVIPHQTHLHTGTGIASPLHCFISQPVNSEVSQPELSHIPPPSALNKTVHAEEHKPSKAASTHTRVFLKKKIFRFRF